MNLKNYKSTKIVLTGKNSVFAVPNMLQKTDLRNSGMVYWIILQAVKPILRVIFREETDRRAKTGSEESLDQSNTRKR